jgi:mxaL protein
MNWTSLRDPRTWFVAAALALTVLALVVPRISLNRDVYDVLAVIDITTSMNTRDATRGSETVSRLAAAKASLRELLAKMPCGSRLGLGIFTERSSFLLFNPVEVCDNFSPVDEAIAMLDWRMAWEGDSYISKGLYSAIDIAKSLKSDLVFFTDGHEMPPLPFSGIPAFEGKPGDVGGMIVGVGSLKPTPLLKYDEEGREVGTFGAQEVPQENRSGPPPPDAASRPGYHPKWAPFGNAVVNTKQHMAFLREPHLKQLSVMTGLSYAWLGATSDLAGPLSAAAHPRTLQVSTDVRAVPGSLAVALLAILYGLAALSVFFGSRGLRPSPNSA